jgi:chromate transport protein ChrA
MQDNVSNRVIVPSIAIMFYLLLIKHVFSARNWPYTIYSAVEIKIHEALVGVSIINTSFLERSN